MIGTIMIVSVLNSSSNSYTLNKVFNNSMKFMHEVNMAPHCCLFPEFSKPITLSQSLTCHPPVSPLLKPPLLIPPGLQLPSPPPVTLPAHPPPPLALPPHPPQPLALPPHPPPPLALPQHLLSTPLPSQLSLYQEYIVPPPPSFNTHDSANHCQRTHPILGGDESDKIATVKEMTSGQPGTHTAAAVTSLPLLTNHQDIVSSIVSQVCFK
ncbi:hypothetical protein EB796_004819 [Bugula neritina]|uniref:Uncharacterized protein n=1 Tax=Bugula neritina TaxID=10212 RepID=A0A7J7KDY7_BUGNE|nr:hypothetical protein EB796_004819 [Bugula neritina]